MSFKDIQMQRNFGICPTVCSLCLFSEGQCKSVFAIQDRK